MNSLTVIALFTTILGTAMAAGGGCAYKDTVTNTSTWNYKLGAGDWTCGDCGTGKQQSPVDVKLPAVGTSGFKTDLTVKVDVPDSIQSVKLIKSASTVKVQFGGVSSTS